MPELSLAVMENREIALGTLGLKLSLAGAGFQFKPGQYCMLSIAGLEAQDFSIASSPTRPEFLEFATRNTGSEFKKAWAGLKPGDSVAVNGPFGRFVLDETQPAIAMLSGGIGITPLKSMMEYATDKQLPNRIFLLYGNRKPEDIPFKKELDQLAEKNPNLKIVHTLTQAEQSQVPWSGRTGKIDAELVKQTIPEPLDCVYYSCGPPGMVAAMKQLLEGMGVAKEKIKTENFEGYE